MREDKGGGAQTEKVLGSGGPCERVSSQNAFARELSLHNFGVLGLVKRKR